MLQFCCKGIIENLINLCVPVLPGVLWNEHVWRRMDSLRQGRHGIRLELRERGRTGGEPHYHLAMEIKLMRDLQFNIFKVSTDVEFTMQADDTTNPSSLEMRSLPWLEKMTLSIGQGRDHTRLELTDEGGG